jgi:hypothetical protein
MAVGRSSRDVQLWFLYCMPSDIGAGISIFIHIVGVLVCVCARARLSACVCVLVCVCARASLKKYGKYVLSNRKMVDTHKKLIGVYSFQEAGNRQAFQVNFSLFLQVVVAVLLDNFFKVK